MINTTHLSDSNFPDLAFIFSRKPDTPLPSYGAREEGGWQALAKKKKNSRVVITRLAGSLQIFRRVIVRMPKAL